MGKNKKSGKVTLKEVIGAINRVKNLDSVPKARLMAFAAQDHSGNMQKIFSLVTEALKLQEEHRLLDVAKDEKWDEFKEAHVKLEKFPQ